MKWIPKIGLAFALLASDISALAAESESDRPQVVLSAAQFDRLSDLEAQLRNSTSEPIWVYPYVSIIGFGIETQIERWNPGAESWEQGARCPTCGTGGLDLTWKVDPGVKVDLAVQCPFGVKATNEGIEITFHGENGDRRPWAGKYRVVVEYAMSPWSGRNVPPDIRKVTSSVFELIDKRAPNPSMQPTGSAGG